MDNELSKRVARLQRGEFGSEDLIRIFTGLRDRSLGRRVFKEVADFIAHPREKDQGPAFEIVRDIATNVRWTTGHLKDANRNVSRDALCEAMRAAQRLGVGTVAARKLGLRLEVVHSVIGQVYRKVEGISDNQVLWTKKPTQREILVLTEFLCLLTFDGAFTESDLFSDFAQVLERNGLIGRDEWSSLEGAAPYLTMFVLVHMHMANIVLPSGERVQLFLAGEHELCIRMSISSHLESMLHVPVFITSLLRADYMDACTAEKLNHREPVPLEIGPDNRIRLIE